MVLCDQYNKGFHTTCLEPPLESIPEGPWLCEDCTESRQTKSIDTPVVKIVDNQTDNLQDKSDKLVTASEVVDLTDMRTDITQDYSTLQYLKEGTFAVDTPEQEKTRIRAKSYRYAYDSDQLMHKASGKPIPDIIDRTHIIAKHHSMLLLTMINCSIPVSIRQSMPSIRQSMSSISL